MTKAMTLAEALAVYAYLHNMEPQPSPDALRESWIVICRHAQKAIAKATGNGEPTT